MIFETVIASRGCWFNNLLKYSRKYFVDGSICHFKFPQLVLAHILGKVGTLRLVLLVVLSQNMPTNFHEIGSYLTDRAKLKWHFFETV